MAEDSDDTLDVVEARERIGRLWGLDRALTRAELGRALKLSPEYGGEHVSKMERGKTAISGPIEVMIEAMLDGYRPRHIATIIKPGYPRRSGD